MARKINLNRQLLGLEDLLFGEGTETQTRGGQEVIISKINIGTLPFNETQTLLEWLNSTDITTLISSIPELLSIYEKLPMLLELDTSTIEIIDAITKYLGLSVTINTLNPSEQATASYDSLTGILTLGIPKGDIGLTGPKGDTGDIGPKGDKGDIGPQGPNGDIGLQGPKGAMGNSIESVIKTSGNSAPGTTDTYTITFTDLSTSNFTVYNGANGDGSGDMHTSIYDANSNGIVDNAQMLSLDLTNTTPPTIGQIKWNQDEGTADLGLYGAVLQVGQENIRTIRNGTASTITNGTLCMFNGTIGNSGRIKVKPFTAGFNEAMYLYGVATQNILAGTDGIITIDGKVRDIDTTGASVGEVWADEDILYAKPNDNGRLTNVMPADNELKIVVASVIHAHTSGTLEIRFTPFNENMYYTKVQSDLLLEAKANLTDIVDSLTSTESQKPLSANQGKILKTLIDDINTLLSSDDTTLDEFQEIVNFIKQNKTDLQNLDLSNIAETATLKHFTSIEKSKLNGIAENANNYSLPVATNTILGGVKAGANITIDAEGVISASASSGGAATETSAGLIELATTAETQAGTDDSRAITPLKLFNSLKGSNQALSVNGYQKLHGGLIIQWGTFNTSTASYVTVAFPISFPNACLGITGSINNESQFGSLNYGNKTVNGFSASNWYYNGATNARNAVSNTYIAIGY